MWESLLTKLGIDTVKSGIKSAGKLLSKREYAELISEAIRELLKLHPDISGAEARILAAEALNLPPSVELMSARRLLKAAKKERKSGSRHKAKKKAPKPAKKKARKVAKKKAKKVARKKTKKKLAKKMAKKTMRKRSKAVANRKPRRKARSRTRQRR